MSIVVFNWMHYSVRTRWSIALNQIWIVVRVRRRSALAGEPSPCRPPSPSRRVSGRPLRKWLLRCNKCSPSLWSTAGCGSSWCRGGTGRRRRSKPQTRSRRDGRGSSPKRQKRPIRSTTFYWSISYYLRPNSFHLATSTCDKTKMNLFLYIASQNWSECGPEQIMKLIFFLLFKAKLIFWWPEFSRYIILYAPEHTRSRLPPPWPWSSPLCPWETSCPGPAFVTTLTRPTFCRPRPVNSP